jgi:hypothetical protein
MGADRPDEVRTHTQLRHRPRVVSQYACKIVQSDACKPVNADILAATLQQEETKSMYTPRTLRFDSAAGAFVDTEVDQVPACHSCSAPLHGGTFSPRNGSISTHSAPLVCDTLPSTGTADSSASGLLQPGLLGAGHGLWRLVQDIERMPVCV